MPSLPSATTRLSDQAGVAPVSTDLVAIFGACVDNDDGVPRVYASTSSALDEHGYCESLELGALQLQGAGKPYLFVPLPIATAGIVRRQESVHTGTSKVTCAVGSDGSLAEVDGAIVVVSGGTVGTDQILLSLSLDGEVSFSPLRLGTATSYVLPRIGITVSFGVGTLVEGDTILLFKTTAPLFDSTGVALGATAMAAQQRGVRSWVFVGDVSTLALGQAIETAANAYATTHERHVVAKFQARDRRVLESSRQRCGMVGSNSITFLEVGGTGDTITRAAGSFVTDGFQVGDWIEVTGGVTDTGHNNISGKITVVTALVLTLDDADLINEGPITTVAITTEPSFIFATPGMTITRNRGSWTAEGFAVGDTVTIEGTASNDGTAIITTLSATVMTCAASTFVAETIGSCTASVTLDESVTVWKVAIEDLFDTIDGSERVDIGGGRLTKLSPILGFTMRRPVQWADTVRSYEHDVKTPTWWKDLGPLDGWGIDGEFDERVDSGLLAARFTCARTWANGPQGAFIARSLTRATDGSILGDTHNMYVASLAQTVVQRTTERFVGQTLVLNTDGTATTSALADLEAKVNSELQTNLLSDVGGEGQRASRASWTAATDDDLSVAEATLNGTLALNLNGTIVHIATVVEVS